jgi:type II secretory pathway component PulC
MLSTSSLNLADALRSKRAAITTQYLLTAFCIYLILHMLWTFYAFRPAQQTEPTTRVIAKAPIISQWHLFGVYQSFDSDLLPRTQLNISLQGIFYSDDPQQSQVLIADGSNVAKVYNIGQEVAGAVIKKILPYTVILEVAGNLQQLPLPKPQLDFAPPPQDLLQK